MLFTSPVLLPDVFQDVNGFLKTPFPPGKHTLHLLDSCKELKAMNFPGNSISTRGWVNPIKSKRQMKEGGESGDLQAISKICPLPANLFQNLTHDCVLPRQRLMSMSFLGKKTIVVHILWKNRHIGCSPCITVFPDIICELRGSTDVSAILLHPKAQGRLVGLSVDFPRVLDQGQSSWFPTTHLMLTYRYRGTESMLVCNAGALVELHQHGLQKMQEQLAISQIYPNRHLAYFT